MSTDLTDQDWRCPRCETEWSAAYTECKYCSDETGAAMPIDLTDEDREIICLISEADDSGVQMELLEDCYARGLAAGRARAIEDCANVCDEYAADDGSAYGCAAAIRALNAASPAS